MRSRLRKDYGITHSLVPLLTPSPPKQAQQFIEMPERKYSPLFTKDNFVNPHTIRSRKHRLLEEKNTDIQKQNRRLYEKLRRIKMKNAFQSETKLDSMNAIPQETLFGNSVSKPLSLPQVVNNFYSPESTKSKLNGILNDRKTFVSKYFEELAHLRNKMPKKTEELGDFICNQWRIKVLLLDEQFIVMRGRKGIRELTKKYNWERVKNKMKDGLENWVRLKFEFEE